MKATRWIGSCLCVIALASIVNSAYAKRGWRYYPTHHHVVCVSPKVIVRPASVIKVTTTSKDRLAMAVAYLRENDYLKVYKYAAMTGMTRSHAEAELNAFCTGKRNSLLKVKIDGRIRYTLA